MTPNGHFPLSAEDPIEALDLGTRAQNALKRTGLKTIGDLIRRIAEGTLHNVSQFGSKSEEEVREKLEIAGINLDAYSLEHIERRIEQPVPQQPELVEQLFGRVFQSLELFAQSQARAGLIHLLAQHRGVSLADWFVASEKCSFIGEILPIFDEVFSRTLSISDELLRLLQSPTLRDLQILIARYGLGQDTLEKIGEELGLTRERIRQICQRFEQRVNDRYCTDRISTIRFQTALLIAQDMGENLTFATWEDHVRQSGLLGRWKSEHGEEIDPFEVLIAVANMLAQVDPVGSLVPRNLRVVFELAKEGKNTVSVGAENILRSLLKQTKKLIGKHARFSGAVHARWLSESTNIPMLQMRQVLIALGYTAVSQKWFLPHVDRHASYSLTRHDVFHRSLRKMFQYCGPLHLKELSFGLRLAISRTDFPPPPPDVLKDLLNVYGYSLSEGRYYFDGDFDENLSTSEKIILSCLQRYGPVVNHQELAQAFVDSELSFPSLHATLRRSPIFEKVAYGLYKLRGQTVSLEDIQRAEAASEPVPIELDVSYDIRGNITILLNLNVTAIGTGTIQVYRTELPNLSGEWDCYVDKHHFGKLVATENEFRHLRQPLEFMECTIGDRLKFTFNTWDRVVTIERADV